MDLLVPYYTYHKQIYFFCKISRKKFKEWHKKSCACLIFDDFNFLREQYPPSIICMNYQKLGLKDLLVQLNRAVNILV